MPYPYRSTTWTYASGSPVLVSGTSPTLDDGTDTPIPTPPTVHTYTFNPVDSRRIIKASDSNNYTWRAFAEMYQGAWWDSGITTYYTGVVRFNISGLTGTVTDATLTVHRNNGGTSGKAWIKCYKMNSDVVYENDEASVSHGATHNSTLIGSAQVNQNSDAAISIAANQIQNNTTLYIVFDAGETSVQTGYSESANTSVITRTGMTLTVNTK